MQFTASFYKEFAVNNKTNSNEEGIKRIYADFLGFKTPIYADVGFCNLPLSGITQLTSQMRHLISKLQKWSEGRKIAYAHMWQNFSDRISYRNDPYDSTMELSHIYTDGKRNLEQILLRCYSNENTDHTTAVISSLTKYDLHQCLSGANIAISGALNALTNNTWPEKIQRFKMDLVEQSAFDYLQRISCLAPHKHSVTDLCNFVADTYHLKSIRDKYAGFTSSITGHTFTYDLQQHFAVNLLCLISDQLSHAASKIKTFDDCKALEKELAIFGEDPKFNILSIMEDLDDPNKIKLASQTTIVFQLRCTLFERLLARKYISLEPRRYYHSKDKQQSLVICDESLQFSYFESYDAKQYLYTRGSLYHIGAPCKFSQLSDLFLWAVRIKNQQLLQFILSLNETLPVANKIFIEELSKWSFAELSDPIVALSQHPSLKTLNLSKHNIFAEFMIEGIISGKTESVRALIALGVPVDYVTQRGEYAGCSGLYIATKKKLPKMMQVLLLAGADPLFAERPGNKIVTSALKLSIEEAYEFAANLLMQYVPFSKAAELESVIEATSSICKTSVLSNLISGRCEAVRLKEQDPFMLLPAEKLHADKAARLALGQLNSEKCEVACRIIPMCVIC
jgi:hypothetical protein